MLTRSTNFLRPGVIDVLGDLVIIFAIVGMMFYLDWKLALISLLTIPLLFAATNWFRKRAREGFDKVRTRNAKLNAFLQEYISGAQTVQLFNAERRAQNRFADINDDYRNANIETIYYYSIFYPMVDFIGTVGVAIVIWFGGYQILTGVSTNGELLTIGIIIAFVQYSQQLFQPIRDLVRQIQCFAGGNRRVAPHFSSARRAGRNRNAGESEKVGQINRQNRISKCLVCV